MMRTMARHERNANYGTDHLMINNSRNWRPVMTAPAFHPATAPVPRGHPRLSNGYERRYVQAGVGGWAGSGWWLSRGRRRKAPNRAMNVGIDPARLTHTCPRPPPLKLLFARFALRLSLGFRAASRRPLSGLLCCRLPLLDTLLELMRSRPERPGQLRQLGTCQQQEYRDDNNHHDIRAENICYEHAMHITPPSEGREPPRLHCTTRPPGTARRPPDQPERKTPRASAARELATASAPQTARPALLLAIE